MGLSSLLDGRCPRLILFSFLLALASMQQLCTGTGGGVLNDDILGLIVFKSGLHDPNSSLSSWNEDDETPCSWAYVQCNTLAGQVSELYLHGLSLSGKLSRGLERLRGLEVLSLSHNHLSGPIPPAISLIPNLKSLNLSHNNLSGPIPPELGDMSSIRLLDLSGNALAGPIPDRLFAGSSGSTLRFVSLAGNYLEGTIPSPISKCSFLLGLNLSGNRLSGSPDFAGGIYGLTRLRTLDLSRNSFSGGFPEGVSILHNLKVLNLNSNGFSGHIPAGIGLCPHLMNLDLSHNSFTGALPYTLQWLHSLSMFNLSGNELSGDLPRWAGNMSGLRQIDFSSNRFTGVLPPSLGDLKQLNYLSLSYNNLTGEIPASLADCTELKVIKLKGNYLNGSIPQRLFDLGLEELDLSLNEITGSIPAGSTRLFETLQVLDLSKNKLSGVIPAEMALYFNLRHLNLSWNDLRSRLPPELGEFRKLSVLDLRNNALYGSIPADFCDSGSLSVLQLDENFLTGPIPEEIGNCSSLYLLSLSHNSLSGLIPTSMARLTKLEILNLEFNNLSGELPREMGKLNNLLAVNISHNRLIGRLPTGRIFQSLDKSSLQGNLGICSPLVIEPCKMDVPKPLVLDPNAYNKGNGDDTAMPVTSSSKSRHRRFLSVSALIAISAALVIVLGVMVVSLLNISARRRIGLIENPMESMCSSSSKSGGPAVGRLVLFGPRSSLRSGDFAGNAEILLQKAAEIGRGAFGTVYKTSIGEGRILGIKKLITSDIIEYHDDFDREVRILGKARHPNLISLKGYYWTPQLQLLISDYAAGGSLHTRLHENSETQPPLTWAKRFQIVHGTAKGLTHLHQSFRPPIIHYNIKPSNILLDENCDPKVSDFGLARLLPKLDKHVLSSRFQGSLGYMAPELSCQSLRVNEKCDVFSFGVMILELVTGKKPVEYGEEDDVVILIDQVRVLLEQGNVLDCVDRRMGEFPEEEVLPVLKLGLVCTSQIPSSRPSMSEVVQILQVIKAPIPERMEVF